MESVGDLETGRIGEGEGKGEEDKLLNIGAIFVGFLVCEILLCIPQKPKAVVHREMRLSNGISCFPHRCVQKTCSFWKLWYEILIGIATVSQLYFEWCAQTHYTALVTPNTTSAYGSSWKVCYGKSKVSATFGIHFHCWTHSAAQLHIYAVFSLMREEKKLCRLCSSQQLSEAWFWNSLIF